MKFLFYVLFCLLVLFLSVPSFALTPPEKQVISKEIGDDPATDPKVFEEEFQKMEKKDTVIHKESPDIAEEIDEDVGGSMGQQIEDTILSPDDEQ